MAFTLACATKEAVPFYRNTVSTGGIVCTQQKPLYDTPTRPFSFFFTNSGEYPTRSHRNSPIHTISINQRWRVFSRRKNGYTVHSAKLAPKILRRRTSHHRLPSWGVFKEHAYSEPSKENYGGRVHSKWSPDSTPPVSYSPR